MSSVDGLLWGVYGAGGCGRSILPLLRGPARQAGARLVFVDDGAVGTEINGQPVLDWQDFLRQPAVRRKVCLAIAQSAIRERLADRCEQAGVKLLEARANNVVEMDNVLIGDGACLSPFVTLTSNIRIGRCFHANLYAYVEHDCDIGDYVTFAPGAQCNGNVRIENHAYIGSGAVIRHGQPGNPLVIGCGAVVGMGAVVTKNVPPGVTVVGNPARPMEK